MGNYNSLNAICILKSEKVNGIIYFHQCKPKSHVKVKFSLKGEPFKIHAIHIHEYGDMTNGCESLGSHYNPYNTTHGSMLYDMKRHAGDLINNITFDREGNFVYEYEDPLLNLFSNSDNIMGRSVVIHEKIDDLGLGKGDKRQESLITGNAGNRICCGIIGISKSLHF
jgi:Cu-Zn family superoxide dismutase